ncbi:MAG: serine protease [Gammaproteobacteria bacterium]|nr:MAG: serine protease [Gammaproteobacteria bacterium]
MIINKYLNIQLLALVAIIFFPTIVQADNNIKFLDKKIINKLTTSVYEIVVSKIESSKIEYARELPFNRLSFKERNERYHSIGTAFFINDKELMSAAHVFELEDFSLYYHDVYIRDPEGNVFKINRVNEYSSIRDIIIFELEDYPTVISPLKFSNNAEIGDTVFSVGNAQGEGISFRAGQVASFTVEPEYGKWKDIRFTSPASPGNSGGPLVDVNGDVIGLIVKKNSSENHNVAIPISEVENLTGKADFFLRNLTLYLSDEQNNITRDWEQSYDLPETVVNLSESSQNSLNDFYVELGKDLNEKFKDTYFPRGKRFRAYLRNQQFIRQFGVLKSDADFKEWSLNNHSTRTISLQNDQKIIISGSDISSFHVIIEKPVDISLSKFITDPKLVMDNMLKGVAVSREIGVEKIRVLSLGEPEDIQTWEDKLGRKWTSALWFLPFLDAYMYSHCLAYPKGAICNVDLKENEELYKGYLELVKQDYDEIAIGYEGDVADWVEYFSLDKEYLPKILRNSEMKLNDGTFEFNLEDYKLVLQNDEINSESNIHLHFGYSNYDLLAEDLLLFEIFPNKGVKSHYRIQKYYSPSEFSDDEYKTSWNDLNNLSEDYSGKLVKKNGEYTVQKVITETKTESIKNLESIYVIRCIHNTSRENIESNCDRFAEGVTFPQTI